MEQPKNILIVDDSKVARMMTTRIVKQVYPDIEVLEADSGEQSLQMLETSEPDLILMDINMGGIDGVETSSMILTANPDQNIAVCSANIQSGIQDKVTALGITFIPKPIMVDKLKAFVATCK